MGDEAIGRRVGGRCSAGRGRRCIDRRVADSRLRPVRTHDQPPGRAGSSGRLPRGAGDRPAWSRRDRPRSGLGTGIQGRQGVARDRGCSPDGCGRDPAGPGIGRVDRRASCCHDDRNARADWSAARVCLFAQGSSRLGWLRTAFVRVWRWGGRCAARGTCPASHDVCRLGSLGALLPCAAYGLDGLACGASVEWQEDRAHAFVD
jgi:hypothetical protein